MDKPESNLSKAFFKINDYALGSLALMFSLSVKSGVIDKIAGPGSGASVALDALEKVSATVFVGTSAVLLTGAAAFVCSR